MPRRSSRLAKKKRINYNEDALFYRATKTKKSDWTEVQDTDPVPIYKNKPLYRKKIPKKHKVIDLTQSKPKKKLKKSTKREIIDLTGGDDDEAGVLLGRDLDERVHDPEYGPEQTDKWRGGPGGR